MPDLLTPANLLRGQKYVAPDFNQSCILLAFDPPIPRYRAAEFLRIHLSRDMRTRGEDEAYLPEIFQPDRVGMQKCPSCGGIMARLNQAYTKCINAKCQAYGMRQQNGPLQGVVDVLVFDEFVTCAATGNGPERIDRCLLALDRRYDDRTLAAIYRTAGALCDHLGIRLTDAPKSA